MLSDSFQNVPLGMVKVSPLYMRKTSSIGRLNKYKPAAQMMRGSSMLNLKLADMTKSSNKK